MAVSASGNHGLLSRAVILMGPGPDEFQICTWNWPSSTCHSWTRGSDDAKVDVLVCSGLGEREEEVSEIRNAKSSGNCKAGG